MLAARDKSCRAAKQKGFATGVASPGRDLDGHCVVSSRGWRTAHQVEKIAAPIYKYAR
jgi:hypothetical protein